MKRILVVEDSADVRESCVRWLVQAGYQVIEAADAEEAQRSVAQARPDLVLLDVSLPGVDGYSLAQRWRADPAMVSVPVLVLSGREGEEHEKRARGSGALITLKKPCPPDLMLAAVKGALEG
jgi:DNA-binding response OmpR family regulator